MLIGMITQTLLLNDCLQLGFHAPASRAMVVSDSGGSRSKRNRLIQREKKCALDARLTIIDERWSSRAKHPYIIHVGEITTVRNAHLGIKSNIHYLELFNLTYQRSEQAECCWNVRFFYIFRRVRITPRRGRQQTDEDATVHMLHLVRPNGPC